MIKRIMGLALVLGVLALALYLGFYIKERLKQKKVVEARSQILPKVSFLGLDNTPFQLKTWLVEPNLIVFFFHPDCEHCQNEATELKNKMTKFKDTQLLWVSIGSLKSLQTFEKKYQLQNLNKNLKIAQMSQTVAAEQFGFRAVPTIMIYKNQQLTKKYLGETKIEALIKHL